MIRNILNLLKDIKPYNYENYLIKQKFQLDNNILEECVNLRRLHYNITDLPYKNFNYAQNLNHNCENVVGYVRVPTGIVGPVNINNKTNYVPIATTEGALISSMNRGCKLLNTSKTNIVVEDVGMTRSPIIKCNSLNEIIDIKQWINNNFNEIKIIFETDTRYTKLKSIDFLQEGRHLHIRFSATTGDAMGMNMVSKSSNNVLKYLQSKFTLEVISLSGNTCTDKKASAINLIKGRGKNVIMDTVIPYKELKTILNVNPEQMINLNIQKNHIGSSLAGTIGGNNCNASNIIAGIFIATGQDCGQIGTSSYCLLNMTKENNDLLVTINMPSLEIATIGGGTQLDDQCNNLKLMGIDNSNEPGENVSILAKNIIYCVLSCELSLMSALCNDDLVKAHLKFNRGK